MSIIEDDAGRTAEASAHPAFMQATGNPVKARSINWMSSGAILCSEAFECIDQACWINWLSQDDSPRTWPTVMGRRGDEDDRDFSQFPQDGLHGGGAGTSEQVHVGKDD